MHVISVLSGKHILLPAFKRLLALWCALIGEEEAEESDIKIKGRLVFDE